MKIVRLTWRPQVYLQGLYASSPGAAARPYDEQRRWIFSDFWGTADGWSCGLKKLGYDASCHIVGSPELTKAWYLDRGIRLTGPSSFSHDLVRHERPDVLILEGIERFTLTQVNALRECLPSHAIIAGASGFELDRSGPITALDVFFTCRPDLARDLARDGLNAHHLAHAFDERILDALGSDVGVRIPFGFIGSIIPGARMHDKRRQVIERLAKRFDFPIYSPSERSAVRAAVRYGVRAGAWLAGKSLRATHIPLPDHVLTTRLKTAAAWKKVPNFEYIPHLSPKMHAPRFGLDMFRLLQSFISTVNMQPGLSNQHATNVRLFESTGVGSCLLTDRSVDIGDYFGDDEIVTFASVDEAVEKAVYLIENSAAAVAIGVRGQARTLRNHTHFNRMERAGPILAAALSRSSQRRSAG